MEFRDLFAPLANREGWEGPLDVLWRLSYDSVHHNLTARKPHMATKESISLQKGVPIRVLWRQAGAPNIATASANAAGFTTEAPLPIQAALDVASPDACN